MDQVIGLEEAACKCSRRTMDKSYWLRPGRIDRERDQRSGHVYRQPVSIMAVHKHSIEVKGTVVKAEVASSAIERLSGGQDDRLRGKVLSRKALHRATVEVKRSHIDVRVLSRPGCSRSLYRVAARRIALQVEAIGESSINVLEVGVGGKSCRRRNE